MSLQAYTSYTYSPGFKSGEFHHAVLSISGTTHTLYLDGSAVTVNPGQPDIFNVYNTITNTIIGAQANVLTQAFKGIIGDVRVYNYAISATQVSSLYFNRNLVIHYPFDSSVNKMTPNYATMLYDASMVGSLSMNTGFVGTNALTLTNSSTTATQYVKSAPSNWLLNSTTGLTISCWVNTAGASTGNIMRIFDIPLSNGIQGLAVDISGTNQIYSGYYRRKANNSILFTTYPLSMINTVYAISGTDDGNIVISDNSGIYYSSDMGNSFTKSSITGNNFVCVSINNIGKGLACTQSTLYSSSDYGITWTAVSYSPPLTGGYYFRQVQVTQTGNSYVVISQNPNAARNYGSAFKIYYSTDNFNTNNTNLPCTDTGNFWYISFSSPGYGFICDYYFGTQRYYNGSTWSNFGGGRSMIGISDNGKYFVSPNFSGNVISYGTIADNGTLGTLQTYTASVTLSGIEGYCSVANNGNCLFGNVNDGFFYLFYYNPLNVVKLPYNYSPGESTINFGKKYGFFSWGLSPSGNYYYLTPSSTPSQIVFKTP
jgi:hypothetical protein